MESRRKGHKEEAAYDLGAAKENAKVNDLIFVGGSAFAVADANNLLTYLKSRLIIFKVFLLFIFIRFIIN